MEERIKRVRKAMVPMPKTNAGTHICMMEPQPATGKIDVAVALLIKTMAIWDRAAKTKPGTDTPRITRNMMTISGSLLR